MYSRSCVETGVSTDKIIEVESLLQVTRPRARLKSFVTKRIAANPGTTADLGRQQPRAEFPQRQGVKAEQGKANKALVGGNTRRNSRRDVACAAGQRRTALSQATSNSKRCRASLATAVQKFASGGALRLSAGAPGFLPL